MLRVLRRHVYKPERKSDNLQQKMKGSMAALREVKASVSLMWHLKFVQVDSTTAGRITIGAQHSSDVATTIVIAFAGTPGIPGDIERRFPWPRAWKRGT